MTIDILRAVTSLLSTCSRRVSRAARKLRRPHFPRRILLVPFWISDRWGKIAEETQDTDDGELRIEEEEEEEVWRRGIIMGEKCQPLDFSGAIFYDSDGRQVAVASMPKSPMNMMRCRSPLASLIAEEKELELNSCNFKINL